MEWPELLAGLIGVVLGVAGDRALISIGRRRVQIQKQRAGSNSTQIQVGGSVNEQGRRDAQ